MCARSRRRVSKRRDGSERHTRIENDGDGASRSSDEWQRALVEREVLVRENERRRKGRGMRERVYERCESGERSSARDSLRREGVRGVRRWC